MSKFTLRVRRFRQLGELSWSPEGVCLLAGPNGAGKTTILQALDFLRNAYLRGITQAIQHAGGATRLLQRGAHEDATIILELEADEVTWTIALAVEGDGVSAYPMERVTRAGEVILEAPHYQATYTLGGVKRHRELRAELSTLQTLEQPEWLEPFIQLVSNFRIYKTWNLSAIAKPTLDYKDAQAPYLHREGRNLAHVLRHWRNAPRQHRDQFAWVLHHTREAFPGLIEDIEFTPEGQLVFYPPGAHADDHLPMHLAADGLLTGLLQLTALAGTPDGGVVAFDEIENQLHPHAIRCILRAARQIAEERDLTILMTTHSPVVMNAFRHEPEQFFVIDPAHGASPVALTELHDEDWLAQFSLGDLYDRLVFGAPEPLAEQE